MQGQAVYAVINRYWHHVNGGGDELIAIYAIKSDADSFAAGKQREFGYENSYYGNSYIVEEHFLE